MDLGKILVESAKLMVAFPKAFVPRIVTTVVYSILEVLLAVLIADSFTSFGDPDAMWDVLTKLIGLLILMPFLYVADLTTYAMYPTIVSDMRSKHKVSLYGAFKRALKSARHIIVMCVLIMGFAVAVAVPISISMMFFRLTGNMVPLLIGAPLAFIAILGFSIVVFFVIPHAVVEESSIWGAFEGGLKMSHDNSWDVVKLNLVFAILMLGSMAIVAVARVHDGATWLAIALFVLIRALQAIVYTYLCIVNPLAYFHAKV